MSCEAVILVLLSELYIMVIAKEISNAINICVANVLVINEVLFYFTIEYAI